jgi:hypothetical protein
MNVLHSLLSLANLLIIQAIINLYFGTTKNTLFCGGFQAILRGFSASAECFAGVLKTAD